MFINCSVNNNCRYKWLYGSSWKVWNMTSKTRAKGNKTQREGIKLLEKAGWKCSKVEQGGKFAKEKDLWGLWDIACIKGNYIKFIQFKTNKPGVIHPYITFAKEHAVPNVSWELWARRDNKPIKDRWDCRIFMFSEDI